MPSRNRTILIATSAVLAIAVAGCSSSGSAGGQTSGAASPSTSGGSASAGSAGGSPITIGSFTSLSNPVYSAPQVKSGAEAAVSAVNAAGGVNGHPLKLDFCDSNYDPNKELSCTRQLIQDKVSAFVAPSVLADSSGKEYTAMAGAKTADIGGSGLSPTELNSPIAFPISSGIPGWVFGATKNLIDSGAKKIAIVDDVNPGSQFFGGLVAQALKAYGVTPVATISADVTADPTLATAAGKVKASGADGIVMSPSPSIVPKLVAAIKQAGYTGKISSITALFAPPIIKALGSAANGILLTSQVAFVTDTSNPGITEFLAEMKKYQPNSVIDEGTLLTWSAVKIFAKIAATATTYDPASILAATTTFAGPADIGTVAPYSITGKTSPIKGFTRIFNATVQDGTIENGAVKANGKGFVQPFPAS